MNRTMHEFDPEEVMAYLDGELDAARALEVTAHLNKCSDCAALAAEMRTMSTKLGEWEIEAVPASLADANGLLARGPEEKSRVASQAKENWITKMRRRRPWLWGFGMAAAGVGAIIVLAEIFPRPMYMRSRPSYMAQRQIAADSTGPSNVPAPTVPARDSNGLYHGLGDHATEAFESNGGGSGSGVGISIDGQLKPAPSPIGGRTFESLVRLNPGVAGQQEDGPMIARTASLKIVVAKFGTAREAMQQILKRHKGYASQLTIASDDGSAPSLDATVRVPAAEMDAALAELRVLGRVENESQGGEDVSEQHVDLTARLHNARETEQRLIDILRERAGKVSDVLAVEEQISQKRGEIEQMEAQLAEADKRVEYASIDLHIAEEYKASSGVGPSPAGLRLRNAIVGGYRDAVESLLAMAVFILNAGPRLLIWGALLFLPLRALWRRRYAILHSSTGA